jgi:transcriptional regulator with XRE-family HTH domain
MGERIVDFRKSAGLSQKQLARAMGIPVGSIRNWEHDRRFPSLMMGTRLARALGITVEDLVANLDKDEKPELEPKPKKKPGRPRKQ